MTYNFADTNRSVLIYVPETQWGATPSSGVTRVARITSHTLTTKKNTVVSTEIRDDRMVSDIIETEMMSDGSINFEFSAGSFDDFFQAFVLGTWSRPMTFDFWQGSSVSWTANNVVTISNVGDITAYFTVGRRIKTENFINPVNNGYFQIASVATSGTGTAVTVSTTTSAVEAGNALSKLSDANDVIVLNDTAITSSSTDSAFEHTGAFTSAITAGQLVAGQKVFVGGLGYGVGTVAFAAVCVVGTTVTVNDGTNSYTFTAGTDFAVGTTNADSATNLALAINKSRVLGVGAVGGNSATYVNVNATAATGTVTITNLNVNGGAISKTEPAAGTNLTVVNFAGGDASQSGVFTIVSATNDELFVTPTPSTNANSGASPVVIKGSMLRNPGPVANITPQSFSLEAGFLDAGKFIQQDGIRIQDFTLDVNSAAVMTGTIAFMGRATRTSSATVLGTTPYTLLAATATEILSATTNVGNIVKNGTPLVTAVKQIKLDGKAQLRNQMAVGSKFPVGIGTGRFELSGSFTAYFENFDLFNNFLNHDTISLNFPFTDKAGNHYEWGIPALKLTADPIHVKGVDQDVLEELTFQAFRDPVSNCMLQIDRFSSINPV